jgi:8-oxo-dGTP pyrophosphatase MutT (NUDIX family)
VIFDRLRRALAERARADFDFGSLPSPPREGFTRGSVLVPLCEQEGELRVLLTRRQRNLKRHPGQVSFPGGRNDDGEDSLAAALREAREEIGLEPERAQVLGRLDETLVLASPFRLTPWVAGVPYPYPYVARPEEVEEILLVPLPALARPGAHRIAFFWSYGTSHRVHHYDVGAIHVFGATARILTQLLEVWRTA